MDFKPLFVPRIGSHVFKIPSQCPLQIVNIFAIVSSQFNGFGPLLPLVAKNTVLKVIQLYRVLTAHFT